MPPIDNAAVRTLGPEKLEALVEMMYLAATADGEFSAQERKHFVDSIESLTDGRLKRSALEGMLARAEKDLQTSDRDARLKSVKQRLADPGARKVALSLAIQMAAADGLIRTSERELIMDTADALEIDRDEAADLVRKLTG